MRGEWVKRAMHADYWTIGWRTCVAFGALLVLIRLAGRRQISQLTFSMFVAALAVGDIAAHLAFDLDRPPGLTLASLALWMLITMLVDYASAHSREFRTLVDGGPTVVIANGRLLEDRLHQLKYTTDTLLAMLRQQGIFNVSDVAFAIIESDGALSVMKKRQQQPVTPADLAIAVPQVVGMGITLVADGQIRERNLRLAGLERDWLEAQLQRRGVSLAEVAFAHLDSSGHLFVDLHDDA